MNFKRQAMAIITFVQIFSMTQIAHSAGLPACLEGYAFYADQLLTVELDSGETGNGNLGGNGMGVRLEHRNRGVSNPPPPPRIWNGDIKSHGGVEIGDFTINGNVLSGKLGGYDHIFAHNGFSTVINGNVSLPKDGWIHANTTVNGNVQIGGFGWLVGSSEKNYISGNVYVGGKSTHQAGPYIKGAFYLGGDLMTGPVGGPVCTMYYNSLFLGGKNNISVWPDCNAGNPLPSSFSFPPIVDVPKCELTSDSIKIGLNDFSIGPNDKVDLPPGSYKTVGIQWAPPVADIDPIPGTTTYRQNGCLKLRSGSYSMKNLWVPNGTCLELNTADGNIEINVRDTLLLKGPNPIRFVGVEDPSKFKLYFAGGPNSALKFRSDFPGNSDTLPNRFVGTFYAPKTEIELVDYTIMGAMYAKEVNIFGRLTNQSIPYVPGPMGSPTAIGKVRKQILSSSPSRTKVYKINGAAEAGTGISRGRVFQNSRP